MGETRFDGRLLAIRRRAIGLSRRQVARGAGLTWRQVRALERNRARPADDQWAPLANALGLTEAGARAQLMIEGPADHRPTT